MRVIRKNAKRKSRWREVLWLALIVMVVPGVACSRNNMDYGPRFVSAETRGSIVYEKNCSQCHDADDLPLLKQPPKLKELFRKKTLPSGAPATDEQVRNTILRGRATMPPLDRILNQKQIDDLLKYLHKL
jgi:Cytochrome C oxidase, cbb3-type, subunit III